MQTLEALRRKIDTATDLGSVVTTMKTLAAVSIRQYEQAVEALSDYNRTIELGFQIALRQQPLQLDRQPKPDVIGAVVFGTDQGMCGRFNEEIVAFVRQSEIAREAQRSVRLLVVGARAEGQFLEAGCAIDQTYHVPTAVSEITALVQDLLPRVERWRGESDVWKIVVFYNRRIGAASYQPHQLQLLPIDPTNLRQYRDQPWTSRSLPAFTMDRRRLLSRIIRQHLFVSLFRACAESLASENASRIAAMQSAEKNIEDRLLELHSIYNQLRQTAITEELLDVVTGFEALTKKS